ncbi:MAG: MFS transporter [Firmicutes bacterium]|nr:MFS transporter [Bacillota bacterium]
MVLGNSMLIPVFPQMKQAMSLTQFQVGLIVTFFSVPAGILIPLAGFLSDRYGRKPIMVPALFIYGIGGLISGVAALSMKTPYSVLLVGRVVQGAGAGGTYQLAMALTGDTFQSAERTKALGLLEASNGLGKVLSPILGSLIALISWYAPFFAYGFLAFPIALGVWFLVPEKEGKLSKDSIQEYWRKLKEVFQEKAKLLLASYLVGMVALFLLFGVLSYVSDILESTYRIFGLKKGFVLAIPVFSMALTSYLSGVFLSDKQSLWKPIIVGALFAAAICLGLLPLFSNLIPYMTLLFFLGISIGLLLPPINSLITGATSSDRRGIITCLYGTVRFFGVAIGPPTFGLAIGLGQWFLFLSCAAIATVTALIALFTITPPAESE